MYNNLVERYVLLKDTNIKYDNAVAKNLLNKVSVRNDHNYRILDLGCGVAPLLTHIIKEFNEKYTKSKITYMGIDSSEKMIEKCRETYNLHNEKYNLNFECCDVIEYIKKDDIEWFDIIIVQSFVHLLLDINDINLLLDFISNSLCYGGIIYITTNIKSHDDIVSIKDKGVLEVKKSNDETYFRLNFNLESFKSIISKPLNDKYILSKVKLCECESHKTPFIVMYGQKTNKGMEKHKYGILKREIPHLIDFLYRSEPTISKNTNKYINNLHEKRIIREENILYEINNVNSVAFNTIMRDINLMLSCMYKGLTPIYLKDKLNINIKFSKFELHQDCAAGWFDRFKTFNTKPIKDFVTIGIILHNVPNLNNGPTRIYLEQHNIDSISENTLSNKTIDKNKYFKKSTQRINFVGDIGDVCVFDSHIIHDSAECFCDERKVLFITCAMVDISANYMTSMDLFHEFINTRSKSLTLKEIENHLSNGKTERDFVIDSFGKIALI